MGYSFRLAARVILYASSHRQDTTYHSLCYTSRGALAGTRNSSMGPPWRIDPTTHRTMSEHKTQTMRSSPLWHCCWWIPQPAEFGSSEMPPKHTPLSKRLCWYRNSKNIIIIVSHKGFNYKSCFKWNQVSKVFPFLTRVRDTEKRFSGSFVQKKYVLLICVAHMQTSNYYTMLKYYDNSNYFCN